MIAFLRFCWRLWHLRDSLVWTTAEQAVKAVMNDRALNAAAQAEAHISFCPRCGQRPDGDRRMEEAREMVMTALNGLEVNRRDVDFALAFHYWWARL